MTASTHTPILPADPSGITIHPSPSPQQPTITIAPTLQPALDTAASHLRAGRTVAFPTETVYGLGAHSLNPSAVHKVYAIKRRPADNPLIIHVSSLSMLQRLLPTTYTLSPLYEALVQTYWPGPLTLLFPSPTPPPPPAPQTNAIRMPAHPLALALIATADLPVSAPSANSSGRPSPTAAHHVAHDLDGSDGLGCILDGGACGVGVESTVVDGLAWKQGGGGSVNVLRPGGLGVEDVAKVVAAVDEQYGGSTQVLLHGRLWVAGGTSASASVKPTAKSLVVEDQLPPSTPGMKYRHYSPSIPVHLLLPSNTFPAPAVRPPITSPAAVVARLAAASSTTPRPRLGFLHFDASPLTSALTAASDASFELVPHSLGPDAASAARRLFGGMLALEEAGVDAILIEGCGDAGLGLAVMERVGKAVGGGGVRGALGEGQVNSPSSEGRFWVEV